MDKQKVLKFIRDNSIIENGNKSISLSKVNKMMDDLFLDDDLDMLYELLEEEKVSIKDNQTITEEFNEQMLSEDDYYTEDSIKKYYEEISRYPLLEPEEELECAVKKEFDSKYLDKLIVSNLRLVLSIARRYASEDNFLDLIQEGNIGLHKAAQKFDVSKKVKFGTYATYWIRQYISRYLYINSRNIKVPSNIARDQNKLRQLNDKFKETYKRNMTLHELLIAFYENDKTLKEFYDKLGLNERQVEALYQYQQLLYAENTSKDDIAACYRILSEELSITDQLMKKFDNKYKKLMENIKSIQSNYDTISLNATITEDDNSDLFEVVEDKSIKNIEKLLEDKESIDNVRSAIINMEKYYININEEYIDVTGMYTEKEKKIILEFGQLLSKKIYTVSDIKRIEELNDQINRIYDFWVFKETLKTSTQKYDARLKVMLSNNKVSTNKINQIVTSINKLYDSEVLRELYEGNTKPNASIKFKEIYVNEMLATAQKNKCITLEQMMELTRFYNIEHNIYINYTPVELSVEENKNKHLGNKCIYIALRTQDILSKRLGLDGYVYKLSELAAIYSVRDKRIDQIENKGYKKLKEYLINKNKGKVKQI